MISLSFSRVPPFNNGSYQNVCDVPIISIVFFFSLLVCLFLCVRGRGRLQLDFSGLFNIGIFLHNFSLGIIKIDVYSFQHENPLQSLKDLCVALMNSIINLRKMQITTWIACHYEHGRYLLPSPKIQ